MPKGLNKKILVFVDEYGTAGVQDLYLGVTVVRSSDAGRFDKLFSDLLKSNVNEIHASDLRDEYILKLLALTWNAYRRLEIVLLNASYRLRPGPPAAVQYGE